VFCACSMFRPNVLWGLYTFKLSMLAHIKRYIHGRVILRDHINLCLWCGCHYMRGVRPWRFGLSSPVKMDGSSLGETTRRSLVNEDSWVIYGVTQPSTWPLRGVPTKISRKFKVFYTSIKNSIVRKCTFPNPLYFATIFLYFLVVCFYFSILTCYYFSW